MLRSKVKPYNGRMTFAEAMNHHRAPRLSYIAKLLGVHVVTVHQWRTGKRPVPVRHCAQIEKIFEGTLTRKDLRPDDWQLIWPELAQQDPASKS